jgi:hypothetical protein
MATTQGEESQLGLFILDSIFALKQFRQKNAVYLHIEREIHYNSLEIFVKARKNRQALGVDCFQRECQSPEAIKAFWKT